MNWTWFHKLASPPHVYGIAGRLAPWFGWPAGALIVAGVYGGLVLAPPDYQQGDAFRIIYVHVPSAWLSLFVYATMAVAAAIGLVWRMKLAHAVAAACGADRRLVHRRRAGHRVRSGASRCGARGGSGMRG